MNDKRPTVSFCTKSDVANDLILGNPRKGPSETRETRPGAVKTTEWQTTKEKVPKTKTFYRKQTEDAYFREFTMQVAIEIQCFVGIYNKVKLHVYA